MNNFERATSKHSAATKIYKSTSLNNGANFRVVTRFDACSDISRQISLMGEPFSFRRNYAKYLTLMLITSCGGLYAPRIGYSEVVIRDILTFDVKIGFRSQVCDGDVNMICKK